MISISILFHISKFYILYEQDQSNDPYFYKFQFIAQEI